jgi:hypothetical protein
MMNGNATLAQYFLTLNLGAIISIIRINLSLDLSIKMIISHGYIEIQGIF